MISDRRRYFVFIVSSVLITSVVYLSILNLSKKGCINWNFNNSISICPRHDHVFVVIMSSYPRANGATKNFVKTAVKSLLGQTYPNWELFVTGDNYEPDAEFRSMFDDIPKDKIFINNLPTPGERLNLSGIQLWESGGVTAMNDAMERAERRYACCRPNCTVYLTNFDDDDVWSPDHLRELLSVFIRFPSVVFAWTKGYYCGSSGNPFPVALVSQEIVSNWNGLFGGSVLHSSWGWRMETFRGFRYRRQWDFPPGYTGTRVSDADLFEVVRTHILEKKMDHFHSNRPTIEHLVEGGRFCAKNGPLWYPE